MPSVGTAESSMWVNYKPGKPVIIQGYQTRAQVKVRTVHPVDFFNQTWISHAIIFELSITTILSYTWTTCDSKAKLLSITKLSILSIFSRNRCSVKVIIFKSFSMEKAFKKQIAIWKKAVIKYRLTSSDAANEINDLLRRIRDSGDQDLVKRITSKYSKSGSVWELSGCCILINLLVFFRLSFS